MSYVKPEHVSGATNSVRVLYDGQDNDYAIALISWKGRDTFAIRWNGDDKKPLGFPLLGKTPLWFILPEVFTTAGVQEIIEKNVNKI